jgi:hypothetical protein
MMVQTRRARHEKGDTDEDHDYDYDSDDHEPIVTNGESLDWRLDPTVSHSDWTIEVIKTDETARRVSTYHVHRCILTVGSRKSGYFAGVCQDTSNFSEQETKTSRIELKKIAAGAFPDMLDYVYGETSKRQLKITTKTATALYFLGQYLDIPYLRYEAKKFIKEDLSFDNCHEYYNDASLLGNSKIVRTIAELCAEEIGSVDTDDPIMMCTDVEFWIQVTQIMSKSEVDADNSNHLSYLVSEGMCKRLKLNLGSFQALTSDKGMPYIDDGYALELLNSESQLIDYSGLTILTSLQKRCIASLASQYREILTDKAAANILQKQGPLFLFELLKESLQEATKDVDSTKRELQTSNASLTLTKSELFRSNRRIRSQMEGQLKPAVEGLSQRTAELESTKRALASVSNELESRKRLCSCILQQLNPMKGTSFNNRGSSYR